MRLVKSRLSGETTASGPRYLRRVRTLVFVLTVSLVVAVSAPAPALASTADLVQELDGLISSFAGGAGIWIGDPPPRSSHTILTNTSSPHPCTSSASLPRRSDESMPETSITTT
jgi:hypothetical protein